MENIPVITIDGPSGSGKGTIAQRLAMQLSWHYLDSGALYRATAWAVQDSGLALTDEAGLMALLAELKLETLALSSGEAKIVCGGCDITDVIRAEAIGVLASKLAAKSMVRKALFNIQLAARAAPGLVADGRDMGTVVFPDAQVKFFLSASAEARAERRYKQLQQKGISGNLRQIEADLVSRDERDKSRPLSPTRPADDAIILDTTTMSVAEVMAAVESAIESHQLT